MIIVYQIIYYFLTVLKWAIIINALLSWIMSPDHPLKRFLDRIVEPVLRPFRNLLRRIFGYTPMDFSPFLAVLFIQLLIWILGRVFYRLLFNLMY